jgi:hypothetical protein
MGFKRKDNGDEEQMIFYDIGVNILIPFFQGILIVCGILYITLNGVKK